MGKLQYYHIPPEILSATVAAMQDQSALLGHEAAALAGLDSDEARLLAQEKLEAAEVAEQLHDFYSSLNPRA